MVQSSVIMLLVVCVLVILPSHAFVARFGSVSRRRSSQILKMINPVDFKTQLSIDMKEAMKAKQKTRLAGIRSIQGAMKQKEIEEMKDITGDGILAVMNKIVKTLKESIQSFTEKGRPDIAETAQEEYDVILSYLPKQLTAEEINALIEEAIVKVAATSVKDMGKVMAELKPQLLGKADITSVGNTIRAKLGGK